MTHPQDSPAQSAMSHQITEEVLRQNRITFNSAHRSFQVALIMTGASAIISLAGVALLLTHRTSEGAISAASGLLSGSGFLSLQNEAEKRRQDANTRLDKILATLSELE